MSSYEEYKESNNTKTPEESETIAGIESEIIKMSDNVKQATKEIKKKLKILDTFQDAVEYTKNTYIKSFEGDIKGIEDYLKTISDYKNEFEKLYFANFGRNDNDNINEKSKEVTATENNRMELDEIKSEINVVMDDLKINLSNLEANIRALGDGENLKRIYIEQNIDILNSTEENINRLSHCEEMISEFLKE